MRYLRVLASLLLFACGLQPQATQAQTESYRIESKIGGKRAITLIHLFPESPFANPKLLEQIKTIDLDHVAFLDETEQDREPGASSDLQELRGKIEASGIPTVQIAQKKDFFKRLGEVWNLSFRHPDRKASKADYRYGLVSTTIESATFSAMLFTTGEVLLQNGIALVATQTVLAVANYVWNNGINYFLSSNFKKPGTQVSERTYFFRNLAYDWITSQLFKFMQAPSKILNWSTQATILMNSVMSGAGDVLLTNTAYQAYHGNKVRLARMSFYLNMVGTIFGSLDLMQHDLMPQIFSIGSYDFSLTGAILIGYYASAILVIKKWPNQFANLIDKFHNRLKGGLHWVQRRLTRCSDVYEAQPEDEDLSWNQPDIRFFPSSNLWAAGNLRLATSFVVTHA